MYKYSMWFSISDDEEASNEILNFYEATDIIDRIESVDIKNSNIKLSCIISEGEEDDLESCYFDIILKSKIKLSEKELNNIYETIRKECSEKFDTGTYDIFCLASNEFQFDGEIND